MLQVSAKVARKVFLQEPIAEQAERSQARLQPGPAVAEAPGYSGEPSATEGLVQGRHPHHTHASTRGVVSADRSSEDPGSGSQCLDLTQQTTPSPYSPTPTPCQVGPSFCCCLIKLFTTCCPVLQAPRRLSLVPAWGCSSVCSYQQILIRESAGDPGAFCGPGPS